MNIHSVLKRTLLFLLVTSVFVAPVVADEIVLKNNDHITGLVSKGENGMLTIRTDYSKPIVLNIENILHITTEGDVMVLLKSKEVLRGKITTNEMGEFYIEETPDRGPVHIDLSRVKAINPPPVKWKGNIAIGATVEAGNTDRSSLSLAAETSRRTEKERFNMRFLFNYAEESDVLATRNTYGSLKYDYFFYPSFYGYIGIEMLKDIFKDLNLRTVTGTGAGYQLWEDEVKTLSFEAGITYFSEDLREGEDNNRASGRLNMTFAWTIAEAITFSEQASYYPNLEDDQYLFRNEAGLSIPAGTGWNFSINNIFEHNSHPPQDIRKNDLQWILALQYTF